MPGPWDSNDRQSSLFSVCGRDVTAPQLLAFLAAVALVGTVVVDFVTTWLDSGLGAGVRAVSSAVAATAFLSTACIAYFALRRRAHRRTRDD